ncbi:MAG: hypothetical protein KME25_02965 [Symplocastrum torsivum CPER-KK1]|uniref:Uncharacterized protein n=1 Tax=Symplocastrum torsivum CPER-KK1 TaxID=450513 RepID=A0A951PI59_9CYAN|nr:hypothetical protein [Symplocastrum torsivum CPER-KK1]
MNYGGEEPREFAVVRDRIPASRLGVKVRSPLSRFAIAFSHMAVSRQSIVRDDEIPDFFKKSGI